MRDLPAKMAERFYDIHERHVYLRHTKAFSRTSLLSKVWKDLPEREKLEHIESFRELLADKEIVDTLAREK